MNFDKEANLKNKTKVRKPSENLKPNGYLISGPTYTNAEPHPGTLFNLSIKDSICRFLRANGFNIHLITGTDEHGEPILRELIKTKYIHKELPNNRILIEESKEFAVKYRKILHEYMELLGISSSKSYATTDITYAKFQLSKCLTLFKKNIIHFDVRHISLCCNCKTFISFSEIIKLEEQKISCYFKVKLVNLHFKLLIWTTTPYSVFHNQSIAFHPNIIYVIVNINNELIITSKHFAIKKGMLIVENFNFNPNQEYLYIHPLAVNIQQKLIADEFVNEEIGTGLVHLSADHSFIDFNVLKKQSIFPMLNILTEDFKIKTFLGDFTIDEANIKAKDYLDLYSYENFNSTVDVCWRCKKPIIELLYRQLFLDFDSHKKQIKNCMKHLKFFPVNNRNLINFFNSRPSWCVTRQKPWGLYWPILKCNDCNLDFINIQLFEKYINEYMSEISWYDLSIDDIICTYCKSINVQKIYNTMDVWLDSSLVWSFVDKQLNCKNLFLSVEGEDQYTCWWQVSSICSSLLSTTTPQNILVHPFIVSNKENEKISKSAGNFISIKTWLDKYPNDIMRLAFCSASMNNNFILSEDILEQAKINYILIRTHLRFLYNHSCEILDLEELNSIDYQFLVYLKQKINTIYVNFKKKMDLSTMLNPLLKLIHFINILFIELNKKFLMDKSYNSARKTARLILLLLMKNFDACIPFTISDMFDSLKDSDILERLLNKLFLKKDISEIVFLEKIRYNIIIQTDKIILKLNLTEYDLLQKNINLQKQIEQLLFKLNKPIDFQIHE